MKYSVFTVELPDMTIEEALKKMEEYGYDGVDFRVTEIKRSLRRSRRLTGKTITAPWI